MSKKNDHCTFGEGGSMVCQVCGQVQEVAYPISIPVIVAMIKAFIKIHKNCPTFGFQSRNSEGVIPPQT